ncbi:unnamed protein product [Candidula unifasciata]|uniref:Bis(5'-adenosyl)-triphosphatase n=1 Tax=Candidula unifasciata TaxID=100452 RepID=A0A8S3Z3B7_9EUPU|nr:unnamed protein product [Candidula unifasciata]
MENLFSASESQFNPVPLGHFVPQCEKPSDPAPPEGKSERLIHLPSTYDLLDVKNIAYMTASSFAIVSSKPIVPGHVMVFPFCASNLITDPTHPAAKDLYSTAYHVGLAIRELFGITNFNILTSPAYRTETNYSFKRDCLHILPIEDFSDEVITRLKNYYEDPMDELVRPEAEVMREAAALREICYRKSKRSRCCFW